MVFALVQNCYVFCHFFLFPNSHLLSLTSFLRLEEYGQLSTKAKFESEAETAILTETKWNFWNIYQIAGKYSMTTTDASKLQCLELDEIQPSSFF